MAAPAFYASHGGRVIHLPIEPGLEEQRAGDADYYVATGPEPFLGADLVAAMRFKPGVCLVVRVKGERCILIHSEDRFLPPGTEIRGDSHEPQSRSE